MSGLSWSVAALMLATMATNWWSACYHSRKVFAPTKVMSMTLLIVVFLLRVGLSTPILWFLFALMFSLIGDVLLLFPKRAFSLGLFSFLLAQFSYLIGFTKSKVGTVPFVVAVMFILGLFFISLSILKKQIKKRPEIKRMVPAIMLYLLGLSAMTGSAVLNLFRGDWLLAAAFSTAIGGILFLTSDLMLAYDRFVQPIKHGHLLVMMSYHLAQMSLIGGVILHFSQGSPRF